MNSYKQNGKSAVSPKLHSVIIFEEYISRMFTIYAQVILLKQNVILLYILIFIFYLLYNISLYIFILSHYYKSLIDYIWIDYTLYNRIFIGRLRCF